MTIVDARGLSCPQPVIKTKKALDQLQSGSITTIVSTDIVCKNVTKLAHKLGCTVSVEEKDGDYYLNITKNATEASEPTATSSAPKNEVNFDGTVVFCASDQFGTGSEDLSAVLIKGFFYALTQLQTPPQAVIFMNSGINLSLNGSPVLDSLKELAEKGTEILSCGTCLDFYNKKEELAIGEATNMYSATEILASATRIIRP